MKITNDVVQEPYSGPVRRTPGSPALILTLLTLGYAGFYFCRANFSVAKPQLIEYLATHGGLGADQAKIALGTVASTATLAYAIGKFASGGLADLWSGRRNFLVGMLGAILCNVAFALSGTIPLFTLVWVLNRFVQSLGWPGAVKVTSGWFRASSYGSALGVLSLSYLFGDAAARKFHGALIEAGFGWQTLFYAAAGVLAVLLIANTLLLREASPEAKTLTTAAEVQSENASARLFLRNPGFWCVCVISLCFTLARETFNEWTPTYFVEYALLSKAAAAANSAYFPLLGGVSVVLAGLLSDRLGRTGRATILLLSLPLSAALLGGLALVPSGSPLIVPLVAATGFTLIGPYSFLAGALSLDFGGRKAGATASGIIDGVGYLGGVLAGESMARISVALGWRGAFGVLALVAVAALIPAALFWKDQRAKGNG